MARLKTSIERAAEASDLTEAHLLAGAAAAETDEILQTFEALLDIAEVEASGTEGLAPSRLDEAVASAIDLYQSVADASEIRLVSKLEPVEILGERMLLIRLAANIIDNAIKFSPPRGTVQVEVASEGSKAILSVRDQGPGIAVSDHGRVLGRFERLGSTRHVPGHGLGLALVSAVAKRHGAELSFSNAEPGLIISIKFKCEENGVGP